MEFIAFDEEVRSNFSKLNSKEYFAASVILLETRVPAAG